jgi:hypothetical protein
MRLELTAPVTAKLVVVPLLIVVFWREVVPVAVRSETVRPPNKVTLEVAKAPRLVTEAKVSASAEALGQPTPLDKQMAWPETVAVAKVAILACKRGSRRIVCRERSRDRGRSSKQVGGRDRDCRQGSDRAIGRDKVSIVPLVAVRSETKRDEPVAFKNETFWRLLWPLAVKIPLTVAEVLKTKSAVEVPPANWMARVVVLPAFVTVWRFGVVPVGQLVPEARHTATPLTNTAVEDTVVAWIVVGVEGGTGGVLKVEGGDRAGSGSERRDRTVHRGEGVDGGDVRGERVSGRIREAEGGGKEIR